MQTPLQTMLCLLRAAFVWFRNLDKLIHHVNKVCWQHTCCWA